MSQYKYKDFNYIKMNSQNWINPEFFNKFINSLHIQQSVQISVQLQSFASNPINFSILQLINIQINQTQKQIASKNLQNTNIYFENDQFVISNNLRKIGQVSKILASLCQFQDPKQKYLAEFQTVTFYKETKQTKDMPDMFIEFLKGIFPLTNVHKDNIPLYIPFYEKLLSYGRSVMGNPKWQMSRKNLGIIYRRQILYPQTQQENWYLLLTGNKKILTVYQNNIIQQIWSSLYYLYVTQTLKPYRNISSKNNQNDININKIMDLIEQKIPTEQDKKISILLSLVLYYLKGNTQQLQFSIKKLKQEIDSSIRTSKIEIQDKKNCSILGLINTLICQLIYNQIQLETKKNNPNLLKISMLQILLDETRQINKMLIQNRIPYHDFYLRIAYPSNSRQNNKLNQQNEQKILQILKQELNKNTQIYPFPQYMNYCQQFYKKFSTFYLQVYPQKVLDIIKFLPQDLGIWKLLNSQKLNQVQQFERIKECLIQNSENFIKTIQKEHKITKDDYYGFIQLWSEYHNIFQQNDYELTIQSQQDKVTKCKQGLKRLSQARLQQTFMKRIQLPLNKSINIIKITDEMIKGFDSLLTTLNENGKKQISQFYLQFILDPIFKQKVLNKLNQKEVDQFWVQWSSVYLADQNLVMQLINRNNLSQQQNNEQIQQEKQTDNKKHVQIMDLQ